MASAARRLRALLAKPGCHLMPCCYDGLSAKLVEQAKFPVTFVSGFSSCAAQYGVPDVGLLSYGEMEGMMRRVTGALAHTPAIGDGDTGYGNAVNVKRTVAGYQRAGLAGVMIEDQVAPKRCGHTRDKAVVDRATAVMRIRAAVDASRELVGSAGSEDDAILIVARTDALKTHGLDEALARACAFRDAGADIIFVEAPQSVGEMRAICQEVGGTQMANLLAGGLTPILPPEELNALGFKLAAYPLDLLNASIVGMRRTLAAIAATGKPSTAESLPFQELQDVIGWQEYYTEAERYRTD